LETEGVFFIYIRSFFGQRCRKVVNPRNVTKLQPRMEFFVLSQKCRQIVKSAGSKTVPSDDS